MGQSLSTVSWRITAISIKTIANSAFKKKMLGAGLQCFEDERNYKDDIWERFYVCERCRRKNNPTVDAILSKESKATIVAKKKGVTF